MKIRDGRRVLHDMLASPAHIDGHYAFNTNAIAAEPFVAPVERRFLNPIELARIHEQEPVPYLPPVTVAERAAAMAVARSRGGQATARIRKPSTHLADIALARAARAETVWEALRTSGGNIAGAAKVLGRDKSRVRHAIKTLTPPADVQALLAHPARGNLGWAVGNHSHTPEARALISARLREYHAKRRAAA